MMSDEKALSSTDINDPLSQHARLIDGLQVNLIHLYTLFINQAERLDKIDGQHGRLVLLETQGDNLAKFTNEHYLRLEKIEGRLDSPVTIEEFRKDEINRSISDIRQRLDKIEGRMDKPEISQTSDTVVVDKKDLEELKNRMNRIYWTDDYDSQTEHREFFYGILKKYGV